MLSELRKEWDAQQHGLSSKHQANTSNQADLSDNTGDYNDLDPVFNKKLRRKRKK